MYLLQILDSKMVFTNEELRGKDIGAILRQVGSIDIQDVESFIEESLKVAIGNPIKFENASSYALSELIKDMGLYISPNGYLAIERIKLNKNEKIALRLLRDGYKISIKNNELEIY